jgi:chitin disaccharide deacetylase
MLIVNADDWGRSLEETDAALTCFSQGRVTSVTAMTFMSDSERAARIALDHGVPVGLHLNFTQAFTAPGVPAPCVRDQERLARFLTRSRYSTIVPNPFLRRSLLAVFNAQLNEFERLYRRPPTHFDGHRHQHLCASMLISAPIPRGSRVRRTFSFAIREKGLANWLYRRALDRWVTARYRTTDYFFSLSKDMTPSGFARVGRLARVGNVELMTHPVVIAEREALLSPAFEHEMEGVDRRSYADLGQ